jgi:hypothetical protein
MGRRYANEGDLVTLSPGFSSTPALVLGSKATRFIVRKGALLLVVERRKKLRLALYPDLVLLEPGGRLLVLDEGAVKKVQDGT